MKNLTIQKVTLKDINQLQEIGRQTFYETFAAFNTKENMANYLEEAFSKIKLTTELNDENIEFYFAIVNEEIIGYLKINFGPSQTEFQDGNTVEIERIYVLAKYHGKKVGQALFDKALKIAQERKSEYLWLGVWEHNPRAIKFYKKNGFIEFDRHIFTLGTEKQTDIMLKLNLTFEK